MAAIAVFTGLCVLGMLVLLRFLFAWFKEPNVSSNYPVTLAEEQERPSESYSAAASATGSVSVRLA